MSMWRWLRGRLGMGPTRAELVAEAELWRSRSDRHNAQTREAHVELKALKKEFRQQRVRLQQEGAVQRVLKAEIRELEDGIDRMRAVVAAGLNEPGRVQGCGKVRFHQEQEAQGWAVLLAEETGETVEVYNVYECKVCPRSPVTIRRYWHAGHLRSEEAAKSRDARKARRGARIAAARRDGNLVEQRVDPSVLDKLRKLREVVGEAQGSDGGDGRGR